MVFDAGSRAKEDQPGKAQGCDLAGPSGRLRGDVTRDHAPTDRKHNDDDGKACDHLFELVEQPKSRASHQDELKSTNAMHNFGSDTFALLA